MKFFKGILNKKILFGAIAGMFLVFLASTQITHAIDLFSLTDITGGFVSTLAFYLSTLIAAVLGIAVAVEAWLISVVLNINDGIFQSTFVQTGFSISLAVTNLAFVLGIIVIAIATIIRNESYGIKKLLWKLVVAAILVNFGLVIAAPIFGLGNSLTHYFLNCISPTSGGCTASSSGFDSYTKFATSFAGAFQPENNFATLTSSTAQTTLGTVQGNSKGAFSAAGTEFGKTFVPVFGILLTVVNLVLIIAVLLVFILLLLIRYLYIAILAVLMPFAWASWVFPSFGKHWSSWWNEFLRWTFFSPIVLFFIYLAMLLMQGQAAAGGMDFNQYQAGGIFSPISSFMGSLFTPIITAFLQEIIFAGLIIGGMIAANSMGIKMAGVAVNAVEKRAKSFGINQSKKGARLAGDRIRTAGKRYDATSKETTTGLQRFGSRMQGIPGLRGVGSAVAKMGSQAAFHEERKEDIKKYAASNLTGLDNQGVLTRANSKTAFVNPTEAAAIGQELAKRNLTGSITPDRLKQFLSNSEKMGNVQSILNNRPELAAQTTAAEPRFNTTLGRMETAIEAASRSISEATKNIKAADVTDINFKSMGDPTGAAYPSDEQQTVALSMSPQQLRKLVTEGSADQTKAFKDSITQMMARATTPGAAALPPAVAANLTKLDTYVNTNPEWVIV